MAQQNKLISPDKLAARQSATKLWRYMQMVEKNRHLAELLELAAARGDAQDPQLYVAIAAQRREIAEQYHALSLRDDVRPLAPRFGRAGR